MASTNPSNTTAQYIDKTMFESVWQNKGSEEDHSVFLASLPDLQKVSRY
jgi:hypothetical protein